MLEAMKDYNNSCLKPGLNWLKRHWKGYSVFVLALFLVPFIVTVIINAIEESQFTKVFKKEEDEK